MHDVLHGDLGGALHYNALAVLALPMLVYTYAEWTRGAVFGSRGRRCRPSAPAIIGIEVAVLVWGIIRNVPLGPLRALHV
jgi:hypothetical protein